MEEKIEVEEGQLILLGIELTSYPSKPIEESDKEARGERQEARGTR